jgi:glycosyltransferase involved in cell wall biosynthesis
MTAPGRRVVHVSTGLDTRGGISAVLNVYARAGFFSRWGVEHVVSHTDRGRAAAKVACALRAVLQVWVSWARGRIALLHIHTASGFSFWRKLCISAPVLLSRVPVVMHVHGGGFADFHRRCGPLRRWLIRSVLQRSRVVLALTDEWRRTLSDIAPAARVEVLVNPVELPAHASGRAPATARNVVLFLGLLQRSKGAHDLLEAFAALPPACGKARLVLAGIGDVDGLRRRAEKLGLNQRVYLPGWIDSREKHHWLEQATCLALPSYAEGLPMAVLEALAHGVPVVASAVGGIPSVIRHGQTGFLTAPGAVGEISQHLATLLTDRRARDEMGNSGRRLIEDGYATNQVLARLGHIYAELGVAPPA